MHQKPLSNHVFKFPNKIYIDCFRDELSVQWQDMLDNDQSANSGICLSFTPDSYQGLDFYHRYSCLYLINCIIQHNYKKTKNTLTNRLNLARTSCNSSRSNQIIHATNVIFQPSHYTYKKTIYLTAFIILLLVQ